MLNLFSLLAAAAAVQAPAPPAVVAAPPARTLSQIPGVTINYYDVTGKNAKELQASIAAQRPKDPSGNPIAGGFKWDVKSGVTQTTTNNVCKISAAQVQFSATADLPRLSAQQKIDARTLEVWNTYVHEMDVDAAKQVGFYADRMPEIQSALVGQSCSAAGPTLNAALEKLKSEEQAWAAAQAAAAPPVPVAPPPAKVPQAPQPGNGNTRY